MKPHITAIAPDCVKRQSWRLSLRFLRSLSQDSKHFLYLLIVLLFIKCCVVVVQKAMTYKAEFDAGMVAGGDNDDR